jgi:hypothetical protein
MAYGDAFQITAYGRPAFVNFIELRAQPFISENSTWVNIAKCGVWNGYKDGPVAFSPDVFTAIINNAAKLSTRINFDYEHQTFNPMSVGPKPSAGVVDNNKIEMRGDELWAFVSFTPRAAQSIRDGEYRGCSVVVDPEHTDRVTGKEIGPALLSVALTNDPFIDGLHPIQLTRSAAAMSAAPATAPVDDKKMEDKPVACAADPVAPPAEMAAPTPPADAPSSNPDATAFITSAADAAGVSPDAALGILMDNLDQVVALLQEETGDGTAAEAGKPMSARAGRKDANLIELKQLSKQFTALTAELAAVRAEKAAEVAAVKKATVNDKVDQLIATGFVDAADKEDAIYMFTTDATRAARIYSKKVLPIGGTVAGDDPAAANKSLDSVTMDGMSEADQLKVVALTHVVGEKKAAKIISLARNKNISATEAKRELDAADAKKEAR